MDTQQLLGTSVETRGNCAVNVALQVSEKRKTLTFILQRYGIKRSEWVSDHDRLQYDFSSDAEYDYE